MLKPWDTKALDLTGFVSLVRNGTHEPRDLKNVLCAIHKHRKRLKMFCSEYCDGVFLRIQELIRAEESELECELAKWNVPPCLGEQITPEREVWSMVSSIAFKVNPVISTGFSKQIIALCLTQPTDMAFALLHSSAIASLAQNHPDSVSPSLVEIVIVAAEDSRSLYALRVGRWLPMWSDVRQAALNAILAGALIKQREAIRLVAERGTVEEVLGFAEDKGIVIPEDIRKSGTLYQIANLIADSGFRNPIGFTWGIKMNSGEISPEELEKLSRMIRRIWREGKP